MGTEDEAPEAVTTAGRVAEIRTRLDRATHGPWEDYDPGDGTRRLYAPNEVKLLGPLGEGRVLRAADADLIAHAREDLAYLLDEVERLRSRIEAVRSLHQPVEVEPSETICRECSYQLPNGRFLGKVEEYPCPTRRALNGEE